MRKWNVLAMLIVALLMFGMVGCSEDDAKEAAAKACQDYLGVECIFEENDLDVSSPDGWTFLMAVKLDEDQTKLVDQDFELDLSSIESLLDIIGINLDDIDQMLAFAKVEGLEGYGNRLRYANKLFIEDKVLKLDTAALELLGDSIGSSGAGTYAIYYAEKQNGYISGVVKDCSGSTKSGILATASDGPFFTYSADDGSWALPSLSGKPAGINFTDGEDCSGSTAGPSTEDGESNPKDEEETPPIDEMPDGTESTDTGDTDMGDTDDTPSEPTGDCISLAPADWTVTGGCEDWAGWSDEAYGDLFPSSSDNDGDGGYLYVTSSGNQNPSCTMTSTVNVPSGATAISATYNFLSQEWEEWAGSAYNDIFTVIVQGAPDYLVNRTVNSTASSDDWADYNGVILGIDASADAQYNGTGAQYDGQLKLEAGEGVRGEPEDANVGHSATVGLPEGMTTITIIVTTSDVGDKIYDSAGLVDSLCFE